eukprot:142413-Rhodomonas_salina.1
MIMRMKIAEEAASPRVWLPEEGGMLKGTRSVSQFEAKRFSTSFCTADHVSVVIFASSQSFIVLIGTLKYCFSTRNQYYNLLCTGSENSNEVGSLPHFATSSQSSFLNAVPRVKTSAPRINQR